jgi:transposase
MKKREITLTPEERGQLTTLERKTSASAFQVRRAKILLKADTGGEHKSDPEIAALLEINPGTVWRTKRQYAEQGLQAALQRAQAARFKPRKLDGRGEAQLIALACSQPPAGQAKWTLRLLADQLVELEVIDAISHEAVRRTLKKTRLHLTSKSSTSGYMGSYGVSHPRRARSS